MGYPGMPRDAWDTWTRGYNAGRRQGRVEVFGAMCVLVALLALGVVW